MKTLRSDKVVYGFMAEGTKTSLVLTETDYDHVCSCKEQTGWLNITVTVPEIRMSLKL